jgi:branched-chain amino acid transport system substrate-binding protein
MSEFQTVMQQFYGALPGPAEAYGWAAAKEFELAATRAAQAAQSITPKTLLDALHTFKNETLGGLTVPLTFPAGGNAQNAKCFFAVQKQGNAWVSLNNSNPTCEQ